MFRTSSKRIKNVFCLQKMRNSNLKKSSLTIASFSVQRCAQDVISFSSKVKVFHECFRLFDFYFCSKIFSWSFVIIFFSLSRTVYISLNRQFELFAWDVLQWEHSPQQERFWLVRTNACDSIQLWTLAVDAWLDVRNWSQEHVCLSWSIL